MWKGQAHRCKPCTLRTSKFVWKIDVQSSPRNGGTPTSELPLIDQSVRQQLNISCHSVLHLQLGDGLQCTIHYHRQHMTKYQKHLISVQGWHASPEFASVCHTIVYDAYALSYRISCRSKRCAFYWISCFFKILSKRKQHLWCKAAKSKSRDTATDLSLAHRQDWAPDLLVDEILVFDMYLMVVWLMQWWAYLGMCFTKPEEQGVGKSAFSGLLVLD